MKPEELTVEERFEAFIEGWQHNDVPDEAWKQGYIAGLKMGQRLLGPDGWEKVPSFWASSVVRTAGGQA